MTVTERFTTYEKSGKFSFKMDDYCGKAFDNSDVLHTRFSLVFAECGTGMAELDNNPVPYIAPCVFCVNENEHFVIRETEENKIRVIFIHPCVINSSLDFDNVRTLPDDVSVTLSQDKEMLRLFVTRESDYIGKFSLGPHSAKKFSSLYDSFGELTHEQACENWPCRSRSYLMWLLFLLENLYSVGDYSNEKMLAGVEEKLNPILLYIYNNYDKKIAVSDITEKFFINRTTLSKLFQDNLGETFLTYLNKLRITMASTILRDTMLPINEIMFRVGFSDTVHFFRTFKKYTGFTPSEYREKFNWMQNE